MQVRGMAGVLRIRHGAGHSLHAGGLRADAQYLVTRFCSMLFNTEAVINSKPYTDTTVTQCPIVTDEA